MQYLERQCIRRFGSKLNTPYIYIYKYPGSNKYRYNEYDKRIIFAKDKTSNGFGFVFYRNELGTGIGFGSEIKENAITF